MAGAQEDGTLLYDTPGGKRRFFSGCRELPRAREPRRCFPGVPFSGLIIKLRCLGKPNGRHWFIFPHSVRSVLT